VRPHAIGFLSVPMEISSLGDERHDFGVPGFARRADGAAIHGAFVVPENATNHGTTRRERKIDVLEA